jgi:hypothetical protein
MVCLRNICVNTLHKGDSIFTNNNNNDNDNNNDDDDNNNNNNNNNNIAVLLSAWGTSLMHLTFHVLGEKILRQTSPREAETYNFISI